MKEYTGMDLGGCSRVGVAMRLMWPGVIEPVTSGSRAVGTVQRQPVYISRRRPETPVLEFDDVKTINTDVEFSAKTAVG